MVNNFKAFLTCEYNRALRKNSKKDVHGYLSLILYPAGMKLPVYCKYSTSGDYPEDVSICIYEFLNVKGSKEMVELFHLLYKKTFVECADRKAILDEIKVIIPKKELERVEGIQSTWQASKEQMLLPKGSETRKLQDTLSIVNEVIGYYNPYIEV